MGGLPLLLMPKTTPPLGSGGVLRGRRGFSPPEFTRTRPQQPDAFQRTCPSQAGKADGGREGTQEWGLGGLGGVVSVFQHRAARGHREGQHRGKETKLRVCREVGERQPH